MSRVTFVVLATLFTAGTTSAAFACCGAPVYAPAPVYYAPTACGGCAPVAPVTYVPVVEPPPPPPPAPVAVPLAAPVWSGCGGCGSPVVYVAPPVEVTPVAPAPIYVVNQGPEFSGPGIMVPYHTYSPAMAWAPASGYPYVNGRHFYRHYVPGPRYVYRGHGYLRPIHYGPAWRHYPHRPLDMRG